MKKIYLFILSLALVITLSACGGRNTELVYNPYAGVDWDNTTQINAALHNHTDYSDGDYMPHEVVDIYKDLGFTALAITDHDNYPPDDIVFPWTEFASFREGYENRDPEALEMIAIPGIEYSYHHHMTALYIDHQPGQAYDERDLFDLIGETEDALGWFAHPGRYWEFDSFAQRDDIAMEWYVPYFEDYPLETLLGIEVFSQRDRHETDRVLWDYLLTEFMPDRPVYGFGVDDFHGTYAGYSYTTHLMNDPLDGDAFRQTLLDGHFFAVSRINNDDPVPIIEKIIVDEENKTIEIVASDYDRIHWISGISDAGSGVYVSEIIHEGAVFDYSDYDLSYIRVELQAGSEGSSFMRRTLTQPFGFAEAEDE